MTRPLPPDVRRERNCPCPYFLTPKLDGMCRCGHPHDRHNRLWNTCRGDEQGDSR